ncbi:MAG: hypothetical protein RL456_221 [Pseudomonadota bacterium]|jgi:hypothetical protein
MKVFDLACGAGHAFEGWFGSEDDYHSQRERGLLTCPVCGHAEVVRRPSAPRLNLSGQREPAHAPAAPARAETPAMPAPASTDMTSPERAQAEAVFLQAVRHVLARTEDVGPRFSEEARRIHHGEAPARGIRGQATPDETRALREEGIEVFSLPVPDVLKGPVQ